MRRTVGRCTNRRPRSTDCYGPAPVGHAPRTSDQHLGTAGRAASRMRHARPFGRWNGLCEEFLLDVGLACYANQETASQETPRLPAVRQNPNWHAKARRSPMRRPAHSLPHRSQKPGSNRSTRHGPEIHPPTCEVHPTPSPIPTEGEDGLCLPRSPEHKLFRVAGLLAWLLERAVLGHCCLDLVD